MVVSVLLCGASLRAGLVLRRTRRFRTRRPPGLRETHLRFAKPAVIAVLIGFLGGPISAVLLRSWEPFRTFHGVVGLVAGAFANAVALDTSVSAAATTIPPGDHESVQPLRMPVILAVTGLLFAATPWVVGVSWVLPAYLWFVWLTVTLTITDLDDKLIPNRILFPGA